MVLTGFGTFSVSVRSSRKCVNSRAKTVMDIPAGKITEFMAGAELSARKQYRV